MTDREPHASRPVTERPVRNACIMFLVCYLLVAIPGLFIDEVIQVRLYVWGAVYCALLSAGVMGVMLAGVRAVRWFVVLACCFVLLTAVPMGLFVRFGLPEHVETFGLFIRVAFWVPVGLVAGFSVVSICGWAKWFRSRSA